MSLSVVWVTDAGQIGELVLDAIVTSSRTFTNTPTKNPVEDGYVVTDHVQREPNEIEIQAAISSTPLQLREGPRPTVDNIGEVLFPRGQPGASADAFAALQILADERQTVTVIVPPYERYENMLVKSVAIPDQKTETLFFTVTLVELRIVSSSRVKIPATNKARAKPKETVGKKAGKTATPTQVSALVRATRALGATDAYRRR